MASIRAGFANLLAPGMFKVFSQNLDIKQWPEEYSKVFELDKSIRQYEEESGITGFGNAALKAERSPTTYDDPIKLDTKRYTFLTYSLGFRVSLELYQDDLYGKMKKMPAELAFSMRNVVETLAAGVFINGFTDTADYRGPDGEPLFGDGTTKDHPLVGGGRQANQLSVAADLNVDSLELMLTLMESTVNDRGLLTMQKVVKLVVPVQLQQTVKKLLESELEPFTGNNQKNVYADMDLKYVVWRYLTDPDAWFAMAQFHYLKHWWRMRPDFQSGDDFDTRDAKYSSVQRHDSGYTSWRGVGGSPGA